MQKKSVMLKSLSNNFDSAHILISLKLSIELFVKNDLQRNMIIPTIKIYYIYLHYYIIFEKIVDFYS